MVTGVAYSRQGDRIASGSEDRTVKLWDVETGDCLHTLAGHTLPVNCIAYSPNSNQIASCSSDRTIRLCDVKTGNYHNLQQHPSYAEMVVYSPRGDYFASMDVAIGCQRTVRLWNVTTMVLHLTITYSEDGVDGEDGEDGEERKEGKDGKSVYYNPFAYSPRGDQVASANCREVHLWDVETGNLQHKLVGHGGKVSQIVYSPQGDLVASTTSEYAITDTTVRLWDAETGVCLRILTGHSRFVKSIAFSPKGDRIITGGENETVRIWDVGVRTSRRASSGHTEKVRMVRCSPKGDQVASCSDDTTVRLWDVETGACRHILRGYSKSTRCIVYSPQGDQIATGSDDTTVRLWDSETGRCIHTLTGHGNTVKKVAYSPQGDQLASCCDGHTVRIWDVGSGECLLSKHNLLIYDFVYSLDGSQIAACSNHAVQLWDIETGVCTDEQRVDDYREILLSPRGDQVAAIRSKRPMMLWNIKSNKQDNECHDDDNDSGSSVLYTDLECRLAAFSPNGKQIAFTRGALALYYYYDDYSVYLYDTETGCLLRILEGHDDRITSIMYSSQGDLVASASEDGSVRLWDAVSGQCRAVIQDFHHRVKDIAWVEALDTRYVVAGCEDGIVGMWQVIMDEDRCQVRLHWKTTNGEFDVKDASIQGVEGLNSLNKRILKQSKALGEPAHHLREGSKKVAIVAPLVSRFKDPSDWTEEIHDDLVDPPAKQLFELDEEDEGVAKRTCDNRRVSSMEE